MAKTDKSKTQTPEQKREEMKEKIKELGKELIKEVDAGENLHIDIPIRGSANVLFDEKQKKILLGDKMAKRYLFNVAHARRFMQTMLVASYVKKDLLENNLTATLRDLYYAKKRTIKGFKEDTIDEQKESDLAIVDLEVAMDSFRERLHLRAEPKGRMAGDLTVLDRVRDKVDSIDLSRMGSGGWAVPSIVEQIEFKDVGIEYVLVAEKNAIFDRLNEDGYWKKNKCLLMTTAGQAARGARRLLQRLSSELKVPCYCLSVDAGEPITYIDENSFIKRQEIQEYVNSLQTAYGILDRGYCQMTLANGQTMQVSKSGEQNTDNIVNAIHHPINEDLYQVTTEGGYSTRVTCSHSLMVFDKEKFEIVPKKTSELKNGDLLISVTKVPNNEAITKLNLIELLKGIKSDKIMEISSDGRIKCKKSRYSLPIELPITPELCRLLGYYAAEGSIDENDEVILTFNLNERTTLVEDAVECIKKVFSIDNVRIHQRTDSLTVVFGGLLGCLLFEKALGMKKGAENKSAPSFIYNAPDECKIEFLRGCFLGDGCMITKRKFYRLKLTTISRKLASDIVFLVKQLKGNTMVKEYQHAKPNTKPYYNVMISDKKTLNILRTICLQMAKTNSQLFEDYLNIKHVRASKFDGVPMELVNTLKKGLSSIGGKRVGRTLSNLKHASFERLEKIFSTIDIKKHAQNISQDELKKIQVLKRIIDNKLLVVPVKEIKKVKPTTGIVYDLEVRPSHTFTAGIGELLLKNTDSDPYGWYIYSTMKYGSMALAHESERLGCPELKFLGMSTSDIEHYDLRSVTIKAKEVDIKRAEEMKSYAWFKSKEWQSEIDLFLEKKLKAEIQALSSKNLQYISNNYLPEKIKNQDFLP